MLTLQVCINNPTAIRCSVLPAKLQLLMTCYAANCHSLHNPECCMVIMKSYIHLYRQCNWYPHLYCHHRLNSVIKMHYLLCLRLRLQRRNSPSSASNELLLLNTQLRNQRNAIIIMYSSAIV